MSDFLFGPFMLIFFKVGLEVSPFLECSLFGSTADHKILQNLMKKKVFEQKATNPLGAEIWWKFWDNKIINIMAIEILVFTSSELL